MEPCTLVDLPGSLQAEPSWGYTHVEMCESTFEIFLVYICFQVTL